MHVKVQNKSSVYAYETHNGIQEVILFFITNMNFKNYAKPNIHCYSKTFDKRMHFICGYTLYLWLYATF